MKSLKAPTYVLLMLCLLLMLSACGGAPATPDASVDPGASAASSVDPADSAAPESSVQPEESAEPAPPPLTAEDVFAMDAGTVLTPDQVEEVGVDPLFRSMKIPDSVFARMDGVSYGEGCVVPRKRLRYVRVLHRGFDGETHIGELVCNRALAKDLLEIFRELYDNDYPIEKMLLVDNYDGDDERSMEDNNTSCFNFRPVPNTEHLSQHAYGRAIDINPLYNPYITSSGYTPTNAGDYVDRSKDTPYKIDENDLCYQLFTQRGYTWGGSWNNVKDYQHFQLKAE